MLFIFIKSLFYIREQIEYTRMLSTDADGISYHSTRKFTRKYSCSSAISISKRKESKQQLQTLQIDNAWSRKLNCINLTFRMSQHTSSEVTVTTITKTYEFKILKRGTGDELKSNNKWILPAVETSGRNQIKKQFLTAKVFIEYRLSSH